MISNATVHVIIELVRHGYIPVSIGVFFIVVAFLYQKSQEG